MMIESVMIQCRIMNRYQLPYLASKGNEEGNEFNLLHKLCAMNWTSFLFLRMLL